MHPMTATKPGQNNSQCDPDTKKCYALNNFFVDPIHGSDPGNSWRCPAKIVIDSAKIVIDSPEGSTSAADCVGDDAILYISIYREHMKCLLVHFDCFGTCFCCLLPTSPQGLNP
jgi:hypothetical protein